MSRSRTSIFFGCALALLTADRANAGDRRVIEIRFDFRKAAPEQLQIWENCTHPVTQGTTDMTTCDATPVAVRHTGPAAYHFELHRSDVVTLVMIDATNTDVWEPEYAITGTNLDEKDLDQLKKLISAGTSSTAKASGGGVTLTEAEAEPRYELKAVTDKLIAGGKLTATFTEKKKEGTGSAAKEVVTKTSRALTFNLRPEAPRFTVSGGLGVSNAPHPAVALVKTSTVVSFTKDGKPQQAYQQVISLKESESDAAPIQSLMTAANFRVYNQWYASLGLRIDERIFNQPILGLTYRHSLGDRLGLNFTAGVMFSRELEILPSSGFAEGQLVDPTIGLTVDDIPTRTRYHRRPALLFTIDF